MLTVRARVLDPKVYASGERQPAWSFPGYDKASEEEKLEAGFASF
jgi:hypothetical protein